MSQTTVKKTKVTPKYCFVCMDRIKGKNYIEMYVNTSFCHSSYWDKEGKQYGELCSDGTHGHLFICSKCDASEEYSNIMGEGYEGCMSCGVTFHSDDASMEIYEKSGDMYCPECAHEYLKDNLQDFLQEGLPNFNKPLPSVNLGEEDISDIPHLKRAPEDTQGWCSSLSPYSSHDIGHGTYAEAIKAVVSRGHKWLILATTTHNCCALSVEVYEYIPFIPIPKMTRKDIKQLFASRKYKF